MRVGSPLIWQTWNAGGPLIGDLRACSRVTVEPTWALRYESEPGKWPVDRSPVRWWHRDDESQTEVEVPQVNLRTVSIDRSIESDAAQLHLELLNTLPEYNALGGLRSSPSVFAEPGALTHDFGEHVDARARWGQVPNDWQRVLQPGAMLRTYQGYGGHAKTLQDAMVDGNLLLTGVWIVDDVSPNSKGVLSITARDMAALLVDQLAYPPLIPKAWYPTRFYRWDPQFRKIAKDAQPTGPGSTPAETVVVKRIRYRDSSADHWYGPNADVHGHRGSDSVDQNPGTFALSVGNSDPSRPFCCDWFEYDVGEQINSLWVVPWGGNYEAYVSVFEDGRWVGDQLIPYDHAPLIGHQPTVVDTGADIPFVYKGGIGWEQPTRFQLQRMYRADRVRVSFRNHTQSQWGPWFYRCGIREINAEIHEGGAASGNVMNGATPAPMWMDLAATHDGDGYYCLSDRGAVEEFGTAVKYGQPLGAPLAETHTAAQTIVAVLDDAGYYVLAGNGKVFVYGSAVHYGDAASEPIGDAVTMRLTYTGLGYWIICRSGAIYNYGDAPGYLAATGMIAAADSHPLDYGLFLYNEVGPITVRGAAVSHGSPPQTAPTLFASGICATPTGDGYICVEEFGAIEVRGDAINLGATSGFLPPPYPPGVAPAPKEPRINALTLAPLAGDEVKGYGVMGYDGRIFGQGDWPDYGSPASGQAQVKKPGNYSDYSDIVRTFLLWAGFWSQSEHPDRTQPPTLWGQIETTGAFSPDPIKEDFFHNKPIIDIINAIKEIVGYLFWVDDEGAPHFESPNWWMSGNFMEATGFHTDLIPVIDERVNMTDYQVQTTKKNSRTFIQVGTDDPMLDLPGTRSYRHYPIDEFLRGMQVPTSIAVPIQVSLGELRIMAELIGLHIWLARRTGQVTCLANPAIGINDQVRILERTTSEVHIHYVRGVQTSHDLATGVYTMSLTTHWLGDRDKWVIHVDDEGGVQYADPADPILNVFEAVERYQMSPAAYRAGRSKRPSPTGAVPETAAADALAQVNDVDVEAPEDGAAAT